MQESHASNLFASFSALLYALLVIGGVIGDKVLGLRRTYLLGIIIFIIGYAMLSLANSTFMLYFAMGMILIGNIYFKTNANNYVGRILEANDPRLDSAFTYFYMAINIGVFSGLLIIPIVSKCYSYSVGLSLCSFGMIIALLSYLMVKQRFILSDNQVGKNPKNKNKIMLGLFAISIVAAYFLGRLLENLVICQTIFYIFTILILVIYLVISLKLPKHEARGMHVALILLLQSIVFWILYMQTATSMTLFAYHNVNLNFLGYVVPAGVTQAFNPFYIVLGSPILANLYMFFHKKGMDVGIPTKFAVGILITSFCFILLGFASSFFANNSSQISVGWLFLAYGFYSFGELLVSALGASMVTKLLPKRFGGFAQGIWFLAASVGMKIGGQVSSQAVGQYSGFNAADSLKVFTHLFYTTGIIVIIISGFIFMILKPLRRAMNEVMQHKG